MRGCTKLMTLHLGNNQLQGEIPAEIGSSLKNLINLYLTRNRLSGEIPQSLAELPSLELLSLSHNKLSGEVPSALSNLTNLLNIRFSNNMLSGVIPSSLGMLPNLYELSLGFNNLSGPIPTSIWNISSLRVLSVQGNMLSGTIPANAFETLPHLEELYMDHNHLHGKIPVSLGNSSNMSMIILGANLFNGIVPQEIGRLRKLEQLVLTQTLVGAKEQKDWEFITALANCSQLQVLVLRMCEFGGVLPNSLSSLSTSLKYLSLSYNNISGSIPKDIGNLFNLQVLDLSWNSFTGTLPSSLGRLKNLHYFNVYNNDLGGPIPSTIGNLTGLITLYLMSNTFSGRLTNSLANLTKLTELDLSSNNFIGPIPSGLFNITTLSIALELSYNKFEGSIPQEIGNLVNLVKFNAESNKLSGEIPSTLGQCQNLQDLTLQNNMLNGNIPEQLSQLKSLQTLDFSRNNLSGEIPKFIENFTMLSYLNLSFNMFTGEVPINYCRPLIAIHTFCLAQEDPNRNPFNYIHARPSSGSGSFGSVYKGELDAQIGESPYYVAVKVLKLQTSGVFKSFAAECNALRNLRHRNLVKIITACSSIDNSGNDFKAIVFDFMPNGSLEGWLHPDKDDQIDHKYLNLLERVGILLDVANALDYLHCHGPTPVVHCDLKPSNVLLDAEMVAHLGDFGLAKILVEGNSLLQQSTSSMGFRGTIGYAPPEYGAGNTVSTLGDIYSYGILVLEMVTGKRPIDNKSIQGLNLREYVELGLHGKMMDVVDTQLFLGLENEFHTADDSSCKGRIDCLVSLLRLGLYCSQEMPSNRMSTGDIIKELIAIKQSLHSPASCWCAYVPMLWLRLLLLLLLLRNGATKATDELALLSIKSMLSSPSSSPLASWNSTSSIHHCSWPGVVCSRRHPGRVAALRMASFNLSGAISPFLANLSFLRELDLAGNQLAGEIPPDIGRLGRLETVNLAANALQGTLPLSLGNCTNLMVLNLTSNQLQGEIPSTIGARMVNLYMLDLRQNGFSGEIPLSLAELPSMEFLFLYSNKLSGEIPTALSNLSGLMHLDLDTNMLSGAIPSSLGKLSSLIWLNLANNNLSGTIPSSIWNISSSLWGLNIQQNNLVGVVPTDAFTALPELRTISMDNNRFHGRLPTSLVNVSHVRMLQLGFNFFSGTVPSELGMLKNLEQFLLFATLLEAKEPRDWEFITALTNCSRLKILELGASKFGGVLPDSLSNLSTSLQTLSLQYNTISGRIPKDIGNLIGLQSLTLDDNSFIGTLPSSLGRLQNLNLLSVPKNKISGSVPLAIGNLTKLSSLELQANAFSGEIPSTVANLTKLSALNLARNNFTGAIPRRLFNILSLSKILDISHNNLEGSIPQEIGNLINLEEFHAQSNILSGEIPPSLGECQLLQNVYLQNNFLNGTISSALGQLKGLESLDLSNNKLSGQIPRFLGNISMLSYLNLSFNNFSGEVPDFGVFANITAFLIQGNDKLCGGIPTLHLRPCSSGLPEKKHKFLVIFIVTISAVAILGILLLLYKYLNRRKKNNTKNSSETSMQAHPSISFSQLAKATEGFSATNLLGSGTFGSVYKGKIDGQTDESAEYIAVKVLKLQTPGAHKSFVAECEALKNLRHRNLVKVITACSSIDTRGYDFKAIVFDFMPNGSLEDWLHPKPVDQTEMKYLGLVQRVTILLDVAYALDYLHCRGPAPVVHCDIKSSNVLLDSDMVAHVGDFGLAKILAEGSSSLQHSTSSMGFRGTIGYAAPEYGAGNIVSTNGDIYSYGILVLETVTGKRPTDNRFRQGLSLREYVEQALHGETMDIVDSQLTLELENECETLQDSSYKRKIDCLISLLRLGVSCSHELPLSRMRTTDIVNELHAMRESLLREYRIEDGSYVNVTLE
uniref:Receptor kinase-like protein Xa21 n=1 Tax=Oryza nivara TaxID=4536 RepID=A0A0E0IUI1_ORYNI